MEHAWSALSGFTSTEPRVVLNFVFINPDNAQSKSVVNILIFSLSKPLIYYKRQTKTTTETPYAVAVALFLLVGVSSETIVSIRFGGQLYKLLTLRHLGHALKSSCQ